jgi:Fe-S cluster assembly protein SufD
MIDTLKEPKSGVTAMLETFQGIVAGERASWLRTIRAEASAKAAEMGFPTTRDEEWKYTNMAPLLQLPLEPAVDSSPALAAKDIARFDFGLDCYRLVFVDGRFCAKLSTLPPENGDLRAGNLAGQIEGNSLEVSRHLTAHACFGANYFTALNTAFFQDGAFVSVAAGKTADKPVHFLFIGASEQCGATSFPRNLVLAGENAGVKIIESHVSLADAPRVTSAVTELVLGANACVEHCKLQQDSERAFHISTIQAVQERGSQWTSHSIAIGSRLARNQVQTLFQGEGAAAILNGLYLGRADQLIDHHTVVDHAKAHCESHEFYHGILADRAHGVFNGKIFVRQDAQKTNAKQTNRNLLLSDSAVVDTKPQLEIFADDVKCTHGATIGQLSEEALFYLRARGIGAELARRMLVQAFASDVVERISIEPVRAGLGQLLLERLATAQAE